MHVWFCRRADRLRISRDTQKKSEYVGLLECKSRRHMALGNGVLICSHMLDQGLARSC